MSGVADPVAARGRTTITSRALNRLATAVASDAARVPSREVGLGLTDAQGALRVVLTVPVAIRPGDAATLPERAEELRGAMIAGLRDLAGRSVGTVDIRYAGVRRTTERRTA